MSERAISSSMRYLSLLVAVMITGTLSGSFGMMIYMATQPDELELWIIAPWVLGGVLAGLTAWLLLGPTQRRRTYRRRKKKA